MTSYIVLELFGTDLSTLGNTKSCIGVLPQWHHIKIVIQLKPWTYLCVHWTRKNTEILETQVCNCVFFRSSASPFELTSKQREKISRTLPRSTTCVPQRRIFWNATWNKARENPAPANHVYMCAEYMKRDVNEVIWPCALTNFWGEGCIYRVMGNTEVMFFILSILQHRIPLSYNPWGFNIAFSAL